MKAGQRSDPMNEVELKFQVPAGQRAAVGAAVAGRAREDRIRLRASYWDTPDRVLAKAGLALRVRREGKAWVQTLKGAGRDGMTRPEHNVVVISPVSAEPAVDPARHAGTPAGKRLLALLARRPQAALQPQYRTDILRRRRSIKTIAGCVELAFDAGSIQAGDRKLDVCELEIELRSGSPLAVIDAARRWQARFGLWLDTRSKAERGDLLARAEATAPAQLARAVELKRTMALRQARRAVLRSCVNQVCANASQVAAGVHSAEHVHQLRVGLRRLRCALALFGEHTTGPPLADTAAAVFRRLGAARDQAVLQGDLCDELQAAWRSAGAADGVPPPAAPGSESAVDVIRSPEAQALLLDLLAAVVDRPGSDDGEPASRAARVRAHFKHQLNRWHRQAAAGALRYADLDNAGRHQLRKQIKRLRYAAEFSAGLFERRALRRFLTPLQALQDRLGALSDVVLARAAYDTAPAADPHRWFALGWLAARHDALVAGSVSELAAFARAKRFWKTG